MTIRKTEIKLTVLHDADLRIGNMSLEDIGTEIDSGDAIGTFTVTRSASVKPRDLKRELIAIGNDGTFFG